MWKTPFFLAILAGISLPVSAQDYEDGDLTSEESQADCECINEKYKEGEKEEDNVETDFNDDGYKKQVDPKDKYAPCGHHEVFTNCSNALYRAQNCTQKGQLVSLVNCTEGCVCQENYLRDDNNICIPEDECEKTCPQGEILSKCPPIDCDADNCPLTRHAPETCSHTGRCGKPECYCGYNRRRYRKTGKCVPVTECPPFECKGPHEEYVACPPYCPGEQCLDYLNNGTCTTSETDFALFCKPQCRCEKNYYRNATGICVLNTQCATEACPTGEMYSKCPPTNCDAEFCPQSRSDNLTCPSSATCPEGRCVCGFNRHMDRTTGECIATSDCPPFNCDGPNETYNACPPVCPGELCKDYIQNTTCSRYRIGIVVPCKPQCRCQKDHYRNSTGICIENKQCV